MIPYEKGQPHIPFVYRIEPSKRRGAPTLSREATAIRADLLHRQYQQEVKLTKTIDALMERTSPQTIAAIVNGEFKKLLARFENAKSDAVRILRAMTKKGATLMREELDEILKRSNPKPLSPTAITKAIRDAEKP